MDVQREQAAMPCLHAHVRVSCACACACVPVRVRACMTHLGLREGVGSNTPSVTYSQKKSGSPATVGLSGPA